MKIVARKTSDLIPYARNPRKNDAAAQAVAASIKEFGFQQPIVVDKDGVIVAGHTRLKAAQALGLLEVPCVIAADLTPQQIKAYRLLDNKLNEKADWDNDLLPLELGELVDFDFAPFDVDWDLPEDVETDTDAEPQMDRADELRELWQTELGQVWELGEHRLVCGDSSDPSVVRAALKGDRASCIFTDPPYGVSIGKKNVFLNSVQPSGRNLRDIEDDDLSPADLKAKLLPVFTAIRQDIMAEDCTVFITAPQNGDLGMMMMTMMQEAGLKPRHVLIWKKDSPTFSMGRLDYDYQHEPILLTWGKRHKRPMKGEHRSSVWEIDKPRSSAEHPTMKPVELYVNAYLNNSDRGDVVCDPYSGSGTAIIAAQQTGRKCRSIEIDPAYVAVALQRFADATGISPIKVSDGS